MPRQLDVVVVADPRFPGGTSTAIAAEIEAQARAGYRTGLISIKGPLLKYPHPIHPQLRQMIDDGQCALLDPETPVSAGLILLHHPQILHNLPTRHLRIDAEHTRLVVHQPLADADGKPFYDWRRIDRNAEALLGRPVTWSPVGPVVRAQLEQLGERPLIAATNWHNVLDPEAWQPGPGRAPSCVPVIGRHSRPDPLKWPATREEVLQVYPDAADLNVRMLGIDAALMGQLAPIPANWEVLPFSNEGVASFLRSLGVYVYFHHPRWLEAFGRSVIEAMATGLPTILPHYFAALFEEAALYATPAAAAGAARALLDSPSAWRAQSEAAMIAVRARFSYAHHVSRLAELIGRPSRAAPLPRPRRPRTVLFMTTNGIGLGHVTRCLAVAKRCGPGIEPVFLTLSQGACLVEQAGYTTEFLPFHAYLGADHNRWNSYLARELAEIVAFYDPSVLVFDGNMPYAGLVQTLQSASRLWGVWIRRGFWPEGASRVALEREKAFDAVIEPADLAELHDTGLTTESRSRTRRVAPVRLLDDAELLPREAAREELGLPQDGTAVLIQLGAGTSYDFTRFQERCLDLLLARPRVSVSILESPISFDSPELRPGVRSLRLFPASRHLRAFDAAISAAGYNSYHELLLAGTPTLFVPNEHPQVDNQLIRAEHAARLGFGLVSRTSQPYELMEKLDLLLDPESQQAMRRRMATLDQTNGAAQAARIIEEMAFAVRADRMVGEA